MANTSASIFLMHSSASKESLWSILTAMFRILVLKPASISSAHIVMNPMGYISNTGDDGMTSDTGP